MLLLASSWLLPAIPDERQPLEQYLLRGIGIDMRSYSWEHNGLWHTNWNQMTNTVFHSGPRLQQSIFLPDHYVFIPHNQNWEITPRNSGSRLRIVMLRTSPTTRKGNATLGRYAIVFYPSADPVLREFEVKWFRESEITNLLAQSGHSLPPLQQHDSRTQWLSERRQGRLAVIGGIFFLAILLLAPILCLIGAHRFVKHRPIG